MRNIVVDEPLENELAEAQEATENQEPVEEASFEMPEKFAGKTSEEIVKSYMELESELGRKGNEIGELRRLTDSYLQRELNRESYETARSPSEFREPEKEFDFDNPAQSVDARISENSKIKQLEERLAATEMEGRLQKFKEKHPDYLTIGQDADFQSWVAQSPYRTNMFARADQGTDFSAADELLGMWKEHKSVVELSKANQQKTVRKQQEMSDASMSNTASAVASNRVYRRADLIKLKMTDPERYAALGDEIRKAYAEGRVR